MSESLPDVTIKKRDRHLKVTARWTTVSNAWAVTIEDASPGQVHYGKRIGEMTIGKTAVWASSRQDAERLKARAVRLAKVGQIT